MTKRSTPDVITSNCFVINETVYRSIRDKKLHLIGSTKTITSFSNFQNAYNHKQSLILENFMEDAEFLTKNGSLLTKKCNDAFTKFFRTYFVPDKESGTYVFKKEEAYNEVGRIYKELHEIIEINPQLNINRQFTKYEITKIEMVHSEPIAEFTSTSPLHQNPTLLSSSSSIDSFLYESPPEDTSVL
jgi:hypothetical protein